MSYEKKNKAELLKIIQERDDELKELRKKAEAFDKLHNRYQILVGARKEDKEKVAEAENIIATNKTLEEQLQNFYANREIKMKKDLDEQNETIVGLFDMLDNTINLQINYYQKFKNVFIGQKKTKEE